MIRRLSTSRSTRRTARSSGGRSLELWRCWHCAGDTFMANQSGWICSTCGADEFYNARHHQRHETRHGVWMYMPNQPSEDLTHGKFQDLLRSVGPPPATEDPLRLLVLKPVKLPNPRGGGPQHRPGHHAAYATPAKATSQSTSTRRTWWP